MNVDKNLLESVPSEIGKLSALSVLSLRDNKLVRLPNEIGEIKEMTVLDVAENRFVIGHQSMSCHTLQCQLNLLFLLVK